MSHINLLPWREHQRAQQKKQYIGMLVTIAILSFGLMYGVAMIVDTMIENQNTRNQFISKEILILDTQIDKIKDIKERKSVIEQKMALIEQLQTSRNVAPIVFDELAKIVPPGISFRRLSRQGNRMEIEGISESNNRLADFMRNVEQSTVFINGELSSIVADTSSPSDAVSDFKLTFTISRKVAPDFTPEKGAK